METNESNKSHELKRCACCGQLLSVGFFGKSSARTDGLNIFCRDCVNKKRKAERERAKENTVVIPAKVLLSTCTDRKLFVELIKRA